MSKTLEKWRFWHLLHSKAYQSLLYSFCVLSWMSLHIPSDRLSFLHSNQKLDKVSWQVAKNYHLFLFRFSESPSSELQQLESLWSLFILEHLELFSVQKGFLYQDHHCTFCSFFWPSFFSSFLFFSNFFLEQAVRLKFLSCLLSLFFKGRSYWCGNLFYWLEGFSLIIHFFGFWNIGILF